MITSIKPLRWVGSAKKDLLAMPDEVQDVFGYALHLAQKGDKHSQAKPKEIDQRYCHTQAGHGFDQRPPESGGSTGER